MSGPKAPIPVVTNTGKTGYLPAALADEVAGHGMRGASDQEMRIAQIGANKEATENALRAQFEGSLAAEAEGAIAPALAGAARGLSLGLSDEAIVNLGGEGARKRLLDYQAFSPVGSTVGELGGIVGGALLGDEAALGSLPRAVGRLGAGAERYAIQALGEGALGKTAGVLARGAAEGGAFGVGNAVSESALHNTDLSGEAIVGGVAHGALGGMVASGLLHGAGKAFTSLRKPSAEALEGIAGREFGEAAPGVGRELAEKVKAHPEDVLAAEGGPYRQPGNAFDKAGDVYARTGRSAEEGQKLGEVWKNREVWKGDAADRLESRSRELSEAINKQQAAAATTDMATFGDSKINHMAKLVARDAPAVEGQLAVRPRFDAQADAVMNWMFKAQEQVNTLAMDTAVSKLGPAARKEFDGHMARLGKALESGDSLELFKAADNTKRFLGRAAEFGRKATGLPEAAKAFDALYKGEGGLMQVLENPAWGKAAEAQRAVNAATERHIALGRRFQSGFTTEVDSSGGRPVFGANTEKVSAFMGRLTKAANDLDAQGVRDMIQTRRAFLDATEKSYDHGGQALSAISAERKALDAMEETFNRATKEAAVVNQVKRLAAEEQASAIGGWLGLATDTLSKPMTTLRRLAQVEDQTNKVLSKVTGRSRQLASAPAVPGATAADPAGKPGPGFFSLLLKDAGKAADVGANATGAKLTRNEFDKHAHALATMQANPALVTKKVGDALGPLGEAAPKTMAAATSTAINGLAWLANRLPMSRQDPYSLTPQFQAGSKASDSEIAKHMRYVEALDNPTGIMDKALKGTLTPDAVEAVRDNYPKLYQQIRTDMMTALIEAKSPLPYGRRIQLGVLLDLPTDQTLAPDFVSAIQATYTATEKAGQEPPSPNMASLDVASSLATATQAATEGLDR